MRNKKNYLVLYLLSHISFLFYVYIFGLNYIYTLLLGLMVYNLSAELYMHRGLSHNHFKFSDNVQMILNILYSMCNFGSILVSISAHYNHHKFMDQQNDPHDFRRLGVFRTIIKDWDNYSPDKNVMRNLIKNKNLRDQHFNHQKYSIISVLFFPFVPMISFWAINLIFIVTHTGNYKDSAINIPFLYPLMWGSEMHYDHHLNPSKKKMHDYDLIYYLGKLIKSK